ncbi:hypothetical protein [Actinoplanes sp. URMC 104]|uniref:hypothetical protein n=1 Tax=Actinoplanes sp. URMC 104 TaxID=3423409 RepID=UPI003F1D6001
MTVEKEAAAAAAPPTHPVVLPRISTDPLDTLVDRMRPALARAVEALQVAAALEADGVTDRIARVEYGFPDVFALAQEVFRRLGPPADDPPAPVATGHGRRQTVRLLLHGPLYALPSAVFPAVLAVLGQRNTVVALTVAGVVGWAYAGTVAFAAYKLLGANRPHRAARLLRWSAVAAPVAGVAVGAAVGAGAWGLIVLVAGQLGYQLAGTVLMFYRREAVQAVAMAPAVVAGVVYLLTPQARAAALLTAAGGVLLALGAALWCTRGRGSGDEPRMRLPWRGLGRVTAYGILSALFLLHAAAPYLLTRLDIALGAAPLILSMGFVEWRAERFRARAVALSRVSRRPADFELGVSRIIGRELLVCTAVPVALGVALVVARPDPAVAVMAAAHAVLAGAYYLAFLLAAFESFGRLCASLVAALALHLGVVFLLGRPVGPLTDTVVLLGSVLALLAMFLLGLAPSVRQVRHYR